MDPIKTEFTSTDLELITGVKSATLRMWEKRHELFSPRKEGRNIRYYSLQDTKKLLNVIFLNQSGYKISKIAAMSELRINQTAQEIINAEKTGDAAIKDFKIAMYHFDSNLFEQTYLSLAKTKSFESIFEDVFIPFLQFIGQLWQTSAVNPAHEHFISHLIAQKILLKISKVAPPKPTNIKYLLFLWSNEIHEIGLLYADYLLKKAGVSTIYLGRNLPLDSLSFIVNNFPSTVIVNHFTLQQSSAEISAFEEFVKKHPSIKEFWLLGNAPVLDVEQIPNIEYFKKIKDFNEKLSL